MTRAGPLMLRSKESGCIILGVGYVRLLHVVNVNKCGFGNVQFTNLLFQSISGSFKLQSVNETKQLRRRKLNFETTIIQTITIITEETIIYKKHIFILL